MMTQWFLEVLNIDAFRCPYFDFGVVVFGAGDWDGFVDVVADCLCEDLQLCEFRFCEVLLGLLLLL
jgi:hypothetical protein